MVSAPLSPDHSTHSSRLVSRQPPCLSVPGLWAFTHTSSSNSNSLVPDANWLIPSSVQFSCSVMSDSATPWTTPRQVSLSITNFPSLLKLMPIEPSNHLILCHLLLLSPSIFPSIRVFSNESVLRIRWPKYWSFSFNISPSNEHSELISCRMDWLDLLAVQGTLKSLFQHHSSKGSILWRSDFFMSNSHIHT